MTYSEFCNTTLPLAVEVYKRYQLNPIGVMAQAALESGWGKSTPGNMWFGIKANSAWTGDKQLLWTTEYIDGVKTKVQRYFRAYDSALDSFLDYGKLIATNNRYVAALNYPGYYETDSYLRAIAAAGYATSPTYASAIINCANIIKEYVTPEMLDAELKKKAQPATAL